MNDLDRLKQFIYMRGYEMKSRKREHLYRRHYIAKYLREVHNLPLTVVGEFLNNHHATVINSIKEYDNLNHLPDFKYYTSDLANNFPIQKGAVSPSEKEPVWEVVCSRMLEQQFEQKFGKTLSNG